jgi:peptidyl-prolyl cis-trans isomerase D
MFDFVRKHTKVMMFLMFLLIIPAFVLVGVDGFRSINAGGDTVATIGSHKIKQIEWDAAHKQEADRLRQSMPNVDPKLLDSPQARFATLERMVREQLVQAAVADHHLTTTDERFRRMFRESPEFAGLRKPDGTLDKERYIQIAASQGMSPEMLDARLKKQLSERMVESGVAATAFAPLALARVSLDAFFERREVQFTTFLPSAFASRVNPTDAEIEAFYQANAALFQASETASVEYVVLDLETVKKSVSLSEQDLKSYYDQNAANLSGKEERRASHILINAAKSAPAADRQQAKERAQSLLEQVRKAPDTFAELARKNSQDPGSAEKGGDLDFFARGAMVKPFEDAAFALKKGEISEVVESDFGFHIIKLTDIKAPKIKSFEELRASIESDLRSQQAQRKFAEVAETFSNAVYEQADGYKGIAEKLKLEVKSASNLQRKPAPGANGVLANPKLLAAVFSADSIEKKRNTEALELGSNQLVSARITQYAPARTQSLSEVRADVRTRLVASRSAELAKKEGAEKLQAWKAQPDSAALPASVTVSREPGQTVPPAIISAALRADTAALPAWAGVDMGDQGYAVVRVNKTLGRKEPEAPNAKQEIAQYTQWLSSAENLAYFEALKSQYKVQIKVDKPAALQQ